MLKSAIQAIGFPDVLMGNIGDRKFKSIYSRPRLHSRKFQFFGCVQNDVAD
jgi:hypothetical protein